MLQLELYLATVWSTPLGEESVSVLVSCLTGRALEWANAVWNGPDSAREHYPETTLQRAERRVSVYSTLGRRQGVTQYMYVLFDNYIKTISVYIGALHSLMSKTSVDIAESNIILQKYAL